MNDGRGNRGAKTRTPLPPGFFTIWTTVAVDLIGFGIVLPLLPQYSETLGATPTTVGLLVASFSVAQLIFAPVWGRLSDRIGRKPILVISLFGTAVGSLLTGLAGSVAMLFIGRVIDGASGASVSVAQAAAADLGTLEERPRLMGLLGAAFGVGFVFGPAIGALGALGGVHVPFFIAAAIAFVNAVVAIVRLPETSPARAAADTEADDVDRIVAAPALDGPGIVEPAHAATLAATEQADAEVRAAGGRVDRSAIVRLLVVSFVGMVAFSGFEATFSLLGQERFDWELAATGAVFTVIGLALVAVQGGAVGPVSKALGETATLRAALAANVVGMLLLAVNGGWLGLVPAVAALVVGQGLLTPTLSSAVANRAGRARGEWLGWQQSVGGLARVVGPITAGALFQHVAIGAPYLVGAALAALALVLTLGVTTVAG